MSAARANRSVNWSAPLLSCSSPLYRAFGPKSRCSTNSSGEKTLRAYTRPLNLARFDAQDWLVRDEAMDAIAEALGRARKVSLLTPRMAARLQPVDPLALQAGLLGSNPDGLFKL